MPSPAIKQEVFPNRRDDICRKFAYFFSTTANEELLGRLEGGIEIEARCEPFAHQAKYEFALRYLLNTFVCREAAQQRSELWLTDISERPPSTERVVQVES